MNLDRSFYRFITMHACDGRTDGRTDERTDRQTDRILIAILRLHCMQRGKNCTRLVFFNPFGRTVLANGPSFASAILGYFTTVHVHNQLYMHSGLNTDSKTEFSMSSFVHNLTCCQLGHILDQVWLLFVRMRRNAHNTISGLKSGLIFDFAMPNFLYDEKLCQLDHDFWYF